MVIQDSIKVNPVKDDTRPHTYRRQVRTKMRFKSSPLDAEVLQGFLAVITTLFHVGVPIYSPSDALR